MNNCISKNNNSWKLEVDFNSQLHLFSNKLSKEYKIISYICSCNEKKFIIADKTQELKYTCPNCDNNKFFDANHANLSIRHFLSTNGDFEIIHPLQIKFSDNNKKVSLCMSIPSNIDFQLEKIIYKQVGLFTIVIGQEKDITEDYNIEHDEEKFTFLKKELNNIVKSNPENFNIPETKNKKIDIYTANFFLNNPHFKEFDFIHWKNPEKFNKKDITVSNALNIIGNYRKEKSVRKTIYSNYENQLKNKRFYYYNLIEVFSKSIRDCNLLVKFINLEISLPNDSIINIQHIEHLIFFLQKHYTDKQIYILFSEMQTTYESNLFIDLLNNFIYSKDSLDEMFRKVKCNLYELHNEFNRFSYSALYTEFFNTKFTYNKKDIENCVEVLNYEVKLPYSGKEIFEWADILHNCLDSYAVYILNKTSLIYGFFKKNELVFAVEIDASTKEIIQSSGKYNASLTTEEEKILKKWHLVLMKFK